VTRPPLGRPGQELEPTRLLELGGRTAEPIATCDRPAPVRCGRSFKTLKGMGSCRVRSRRGPRNMPCWTPSPNRKKPCDLQGFFSRGDRIRTCDRPTPSPQESVRSTALVCIELNLLDLRDAQLHSVWSPFGPRGLAHEPHPHRSVKLYARWPRGHRGRIPETSRHSTPEHRVAGITFRQPRPS